MPRPRRQTRHCMCASNSRWHGPAAVANALRLAFSIIILGLQPEGCSQLLLWNDIEIQSKKAVYLQMVRVCQEIMNMANESMEAARRELPAQSVISFDGSWEHRRHSNRCIFTVICSQTGKVIDSIVISNKAPRKSLTYCESPTLMEAQGLRIAIMHLSNLPNIVGYVHDNDAKSRKIINESGWQIKEYLDPGHCLKSFDRKLQKFQKKNGNILNGIEESLKRWMNVLIKYDATVDEKKRLWQNSINHYCGDHRGCLWAHPNARIWDNAGNPQARALLQKFLSDTEFILEYCDSEFSTQSNESFHKLKLKYATKDVKWGFTWPARMMCAVLDRNWPFWKFELYRRLGLPPLSEECRQDLENQERLRLQRKIICHSREYLEAEYNRRIERRKSTKRLTKEAAKYAYKMNPYA